jgi:phosphate uptake regulator
MVDSRTSTGAERPARAFTRRVQRTGASSLSVTLPKSWTDSMNLQIGDILRFRDLGEGRLEISPAGAESPSERHQKMVRVDATDAPPNLLARILVGGYITGQDQIVVTSRTILTPDQHREIRRIVAHALGMSVVEEDPHRIEIQNFIDPGRYRLHRLLNQVVRILRTELQACGKALSTGDQAPLQQLGTLEDEVDRFYLLMVRQILLSSDDFQVARDIGVESHHYQIGYRLIAKILELTGDLISTVARELEENLAGLLRLPADTRDDLARRIARLEQVFQKTMEAFTQLSVVDANEILNDLDRTFARDEVVREPRMRRPRDRQADLSAQRIVSSLVMATEMMVIINETTINRSVEPETVAKTDRKVSMKPQGGEALDATDLSRPRSD